MYLLLVLTTCIISSNAFALTTPQLRIKRYLKNAPETMVVPKAIFRLRQYWHSSLQSKSHRIPNTRKPIMIFNKRESGDFGDEIMSKGIVSLITDVVNAIFDAWSLLDPRRIPLLQNTDAVVAVSSSSSSLNTTVATRQLPPPLSPLELLGRIRNDYTERNYLWTGDLDVEANFVKSCRFTDPTLSFVGTDKYIQNIQNLRPILNLITDVEKECQSVLMDIQLYDTYIQTRWNMIGTLSRLPWQPKIDVIGKTKFWFHNDTNQIYFYDEIWEIPANQALLQLITPQKYDS
jgi:Uncharacterized conserved protein (DUF2358)